MDRDPPRQRLQAFAGDPFLARRAAHAALQRARSADPHAEVVRLGEGLHPDEIGDALQQGGLFGAVILFVDLDEAFVGTGRTAARNAAIDALAAAAAGEGGAVIVLDAAATAPRQRRWQELGALTLIATPRYGAAKAFVAQALREAGVATRGDVAAALVDLFADDLPGILGEIEKLALLEGPITPERARAVAHRPAARSAFDLVDAIAAGDAAAALRVARGLLELGEAPVRVMATLAWQIDLIARCAALALAEPRLTPEEAARRLKTSPFPTKKALAVARRLDEATLARLVVRAVAADVAMKSGRDPEWALEAVTIELAWTFAPPRRGAA
jgi:DNA polymerase III subunit delta